MDSPKPTVDLDVIPAGLRRFRVGSETAGYNYLRFNVKDDVAGRTVEATQTLSGPVAGIGLYF